MIATLLFATVLQQGPQVSEKVVRELLALPIGYRSIEYGARLLTLGEENLAIMAFDADKREQPGNLYGYFRKDRNAQMMHRVKMIHRWPLPEAVEKYIYTGDPKDGEKAVALIRKADEEGRLLRLTYYMPTVVPGVTQVLDLVMLLFNMLQSESAEYVIDTYMTEEEFAESYDYIFSLASRSDSMPYLIKKAPEKMPPLLLASFASRSDDPAVYKAAVEALLYRDVEKFDLDKDKPDPRDDAVFYRAQSVGNLIKFLSLVFERGDRATGTRIMNRYSEVLLEPAGFLASPDPLKLPFETLSEDLLMEIAERRVSEALEILSKPYRNVWNYDLSELDVDELRQADARSAFFVALDLIHKLGRTERAVELFVQHQEALGAPDRYYDQILPRGLLVREWWEEYIEHFSRSGWFIFRADAIARAISKMIEDGDTARAEKLTRQLADFAEKYRRSSSIKEAIPLLMHFGETERAKKLMEHLKSEGESFGSDNIEAFRYSIVLGEFENAKRHYRQGQPRDYDWLQQTLTGWKEATGLPKSDLRSIGGEDLFQMSLDAMSDRFVQEYAERPWMIREFVDLLHELREQPAMTTAVIETIRSTLEEIDADRSPAIEEELLAKLLGRYDEKYATLPVKTQERVLQAVLDARKSRFAALLAASQSERG